jgi:hypothetical protein
MERSNDILVIIFEISLSEKVEIGGMSRASGEMIILGVLFPQRQEILIKLL